MAKNVAITGQSSVLLTDAEMQEMLTAENVRISGGSKVIVVTEDKMAELIEEVKPLIQEAILARLDVGLLETDDA